MGNTPPIRVLRRLAVRMNQSTTPKDGLRLSSVNRRAAKQRQLLLVTRTPRVQGGRKGQKVMCCLRSILERYARCRCRVRCCLSLVFCHTRMQYRVGNLGVKRSMRSCSCSRCQCRVRPSRHVAAMIPHDVNAVVGVCPSRVSRLPLTCPSK